MCTPVIFAFLVVGVTHTIGAELQTRLWRKNATGQEFWQRNYAAVYYDINPYMSEFARQIILDQVLYVSSLTCVKWWPLYPWEDIFIFKVTFLYNSNSKVCTFQEDVESDGRGKFIIYLGDCVQQWNEPYKKVNEFRHQVTRLMMRSMGYYGEQQRPNRDCHINVPPEFENTVAFQKLSESEFFSDFPYDVNSVTHIPIPFTTSAQNPAAKSSNGTLSQFDIMKISFLSCGGPSFCQSDEAGPIKEDGWRSRCKVEMESEKQKAATNPKCKPNIFEKPGPWVASVLPPGNYRITATIPQGICRAIRV